MASSKDGQTNFAKLRDKILAQNGKQYWRSVEEFVDAPEFEEFVKQEYPQHAEVWEDGLSRRHFIKIMGASLALAGLSGCVIQPPEKIVPYVRQPEELIPGKPLFFATAMTLGGIGVGLLARSNEGRPTKIEGNPEHPGSLGATDVLAQASLLNMYDPDRSQEILHLGTSATWQDFIRQLRTRIDENRADGGAGIRFLTETITSPTLIGQMRQLLTELPNARWYQYEPVNDDNAMAGAKMAFGTPVQTVYRFENADRVLSLNSDFLSGFNVGYVKNYAKKHNVSNEKLDMNRLYMVETTLTVTGAKADHRLAVKPSQMGEIAKAIAGALGVAGASGTGLTERQMSWIAAMARDLQAARGRSIVIPGGNQPAIVHALAHAMNAALGNVGQTVTYTDAFQPNADVSQIDQLRRLISEIDGGAVRMLVVMGGNPAYTTPADLKLSKERMDKIPFRLHLGQYFDETAEMCHWHVSEKHYLEAWSDTRAYDGTVTIIQPLVKPLYDSRSAHELVQLFFRENFERNDLDIVRDFWQRQGFRTPGNTATTGATGTGTTTAPTTGGGNNANTSQQQQQPRPQAQASPATSANTSAATQPPNAQTSASPATTGAVGTTTTTTAQSNANGGGAQNANNTTTGNFEDQWRRAVHNGLIPNTFGATRTVAVNPAFLTQPEAKPTGGGSLEISILPDQNVYDGRFANNGWLQELPRPITKTTWENIAFISPNTARRLGLNQTGRDYNPMTGAGEGTSFINTYGGNLYSDLARLTYQGAEMSKPVPVWIVPGQPDDTVTIFLGYGRTRAGRIGTGLGYNAYEVMRSDALSYGLGELTKTGEQTQIASTQTHFSMEGRDVLRVYNREAFEQNPKMGKQHDEYEKSMYPRFDYSDRNAPWRHKWGMTIDLNACVGCNACVVACQSENNIPVVGKEQVSRSREMHWLRIDAYYSGTDVDNPDGPHFQPVLCQQCEQAPCEVVCPVHATVHSAEGLNDMVYNRCVGTRYCSNNCPYKVRRFNFLLYQDWNTPQYKLMRNPEVTVRSRGVMEKCTYCTQRIAKARIEAEKDGRRVHDGEATTACQTVCPADAIVFGDLNDPHSRVSQMKRDHRDYVLLNELNTQPRTTYLAALKNQNPEMPDYIRRDVEETPQEETKDSITGGEPEKTPAAH
jgi:molybdopterin-containing oxidoreductase family iron-sulfur binding subunit